jgi:hypothetical protein
MLPFPNMMNLFAHKFASLRGWGFALRCVLVRFPQSFFFWHFAQSIGI